MPPPPEAKEEEKPAEEGGQPICGELLVKETGAKSKCLFIPRGVRMNAPKMTALMKQWELVPPSVMVSCDAGTVHPKMFAAKKLIELDSFKKHWADALQHADRNNTPAGQREGFALDVINDVIFLKLVTIFSAVLDAASIANNWIVIDRTSAKSPAAEFLIEAAMSQTTSRPVILVIDSLDRLQNFKGEDGKGKLSSVSQECIDKLKKAKDKGVPLGTDGEAKEEAVNRFYNPADYNDPLGFNDLALPRPVEKDHLDGAGKLPPRVKWQYHYLQTFFGSGTHYIVCESVNDSPDLTTLGSFGYISANGQALMFPRLKQRIQSGEQCDPT